jgi:hypothetical protein
MVSLFCMDSKVITVLSFAPENRVYLVTKDQLEISAIFLHKIKKYKDIIGLGVGICLVHQDLQGRGIMAQLITKAIKDIDVKFLVYHTQNQHMVAVGRKFCPIGRLFPVDGDIPDTVLDMGETFRHVPELYDRAHMIERNFYLDGNPLYGDRKEKISQHPEIADFFQRQVKFQNGDAVLVVGIW